MNFETFVPGSGVHLVALLTCIVIPIVVALSGKGMEGMFRKIIAGACLVTWIATLLYSFHPERFEWDFSLPLHFCNLANLIGAVAVLSPRRIPKSILYFWGFTLCPWAFLTPSLEEGPAHLWFWIFWLYHLCIPLSLFWTVIRVHYRPSWADLKTILILTWAFTLALALLDHFTGWNYGFVGPGMPLQKSPIDALGPYPIRILSMLLIGSALFLLALLPWLLLQKFRKRS